MRYLAVVKYNGTHFQGWQKQISDITIQGEIERVLSQLLDAATSICGSGRTDAGVHALGQRFHFDVAKGIVDLEKFRYAANRLLMRDIHIVSLSAISDDFHARFSAKSKVYRYLINTGEADPFNEDFIFQLLRPLDVETMIKAGLLFYGRHDFRNFTSKEEDEADFVREITGIHILKDGGILAIEVVGDGFMRYMVRMMAGALIEVGLGHLNVEQLASLIDTKEREIVNYKAPSCGLYLVDVIY